VSGPKLPLSIKAINLYFDKKTKISSNKVAKLGHKTSIQTGKTPKLKEVLKS
jgi:hypothetical protein